MKEKSKSKGRTFSLNANHSEATSAHKELVTHFFSSFLNLSQYLFIMTMLLVSFLSL